MIKGIMHTADFEENTITIEVQGEFRVSAGGYVLLTDREYEELTKSSNSESSPHYFNAPEDDKSSRYCRCGKYLTDSIHLR